MQAQRVTLSFVAPNETSHHTFTDAPLELVELHGLHPETAARIDLRALSQLRARAHVVAGGRLLLLRARAPGSGRRALVRARRRARPACGRRSHRRAVQRHLRARVPGSRANLTPEPGHSRSAARAAVESAVDAHGTPRRARRGHRAAHGATPAVEHTPPRPREDDRALEAALRGAAAAIRRARSRSSAPIWRRAGSS